MCKIRKKQLEFLDWEFGAFFHFGIRTFYEGHRDWDMEEMPLEGFKPTELDCEQWIRTVKQAGAKYAILVCKHHDGFANWPSKYTEYSVANTPWKNGKGDVVREFVDACRKYNVKIGLYYSPAQFGSVKMNAKEYDDYFINQISELLTNYGKIDYLWFDGCGSENHQYDTVRIVREIRGLQPEILIFNMWDPDTRWAGNEAGFAKMPNYNIVQSVDFSVQTEQKEELDSLKFLPVECDCRIRLENWFYSDNDAHTLKSVDELMGIYYGSVGKGANLLLNIAPDRRGLLPEADAQRVVEFGEKIGQLYEGKITGAEWALKQDNIYEVALPEPELVNHVIIEELMDTSNHIERFAVYAQPYPYGELVCIYRGTTVGHKHICKFPTIRTKKIQIIIEEANAPYSMKDTSVYYAI